MPELAIIGDPDDPAIWVQGTINGRFPLPDDSDDCVLAFSDGTVIVAAWSESGTGPVWEITAAHQGAAFRAVDDVAGVPVARIGGPVTWMVFGLALIPIGAQS